MKNNIWPAHSTKVQSWVFWTLSFILLLPIIVLPPSFNPSNWSRVILFKLALTGILAWLCYRFFYKKDLSFTVITKQNPAFWPLAILAGLFAVIIASTIFSPDIRFSLFGSPGRSGGLINLLCYFLFAVFTLSFVTEETWYKLLKVNLAAGALASAMAFVQYFGVFNTIFVAFQGGGAGVPSLIGNSTLLAVYMVFLAFCAFTFFITEKSRSIKYAYAALCLVFLATIVITGSRAAYLGMLIAAVFYLLWYPKTLRVAKIAAASLLIAGIIAVALFNLFPQLGNVNGFFTTVATRANISTIARDLAGNRFPAWQMTVQAIKDRPLLGWGPENFYMGFEQHYAPVNESLQREWWDRPHNILLDVAAHYGILALLAYVAFWVFLFVRLQQFKAKEEHGTRKFFAHAISAALLAYGTILLFNFDEFPTYLMAFLSIGFSLYLISLHGQTREIVPPKKNFLSNNIAVGAGAILLLAFAWFWNVHPLYTNETLIANDYLVAKRQCDQALASTQGLLPGAGIIKSYTALTMADFVKRCAYAFPEKEAEYTTTSADALQQAVAIQPLYSRAWISLGGFTNILAAREPDVAKRQEIIAKAHEYLLKAKELSPKRIEVLNELQINYLLAADYESMKATAEECIAVNPEQGVCNWYLGIAQIFTGDQVHGKENIQLSKDKGYTDPALLQLAIAYLSQKNYQDALATYDQLNKMNGQNPGWHARAAALAYELGDYQKAAKETLEVFRIQPDNPESLQFLEILLQEKGKDPVIRDSIAHVYGKLGVDRGDKTLVQKAISIYEQLIRENPKEYSYHLELAYLYPELTRYADARTQALITVKLNPDKRQEMQDLLNRLSVDPSFRMIP